MDPPHVPATSFICSSNENISVHLAGLDGHFPLGIGPLVLVVIYDHQNAQNTTTCMRWHLLLIFLSIGIERNECADLAFLVVYTHVVVSKKPPPLFTLQMKFNFIY